MSRINLSAWEDGTQRLVVGYDHPASGAFWQEWASVEEIQEAEHRFDKMSEDDPEYEKVMVIVEVGVKREGGMWPGIPLDKFRESVPEDLRDLITDEVMELLKAHKADLDSGYNKGPISLVK